MKTKSKGLGIAAAFAGLIAAAVLLVGGFVTHNPVAENAFGALAGPDIPSLYLNWGGVRIYNGAKALTVSSTTPCAIQSPVSTSTLLSAGIQLDVASSSATIWTIGIGSTAFATTTQIGTNYAVGASKQAFINASTSPAAGAAEVIAPNKWIVFSETGGITAGDAGTGFVPSGRCQATFVDYTPR